MLLDILSYTTLISQKDKTMKNKKDIHNKILDYLNDCCFDIQGISSSSSLSSAAEVQLAKILTKVVIATASIWWSIIELREFIANRKISKGIS